MQKSKNLTIGTLSRLAGITPDTLRYYEKMKLIKASRSASGYRLYAQDTLEIISFIRGAKTLNFSLDEIRQLLTLKTSDQTTCAEILRHTETKIAEAETKIRELKKIKKALVSLVQKCPGDNTPVSCCPIIDHIKGTAFLLAILLIAMPHATFAKPISYVGGTMAMQENDETGNTLSLDYTLTPNYAVGLYTKQERGGKEFNTIGPQLNSLLKRWNLPDGQGNIFNMTGAGVSHFHGEEKASAWTGFLADYETRRIFTSMEARFMTVDSIENSAWERGRVGFAPYLANYNDINTWLMLQVDHHPAKQYSTVVTPLVRFFYKTTLVEAGISNHKDVMFNWQLQF